jgi:hypothetical protein
MNKENGNRISEVSSGYSNGLAAFTPEAATSLQVRLKLSISCLSILYLSVQARQHRLPPVLVYHRRQ